MDGLNKEVDDLKDQLSNVTEERNALLEANRKLSGEIKRQRDKFTLFKNFFETESEENDHKDSQALVTGDVDATNLGILAKNEETDPQFKHEDCDDLVLDRIQEPGEEWNEFNLSVGDITDANGSLELGAEPENDTSRIANTVVIPVVKTAKGIKGHFCQECGHAAKDLVRLKYHYESVHDMVDKKFKCEKCPYSSHLENYLKKHVVSKHGAKGHICSDCGSAFSTGAKLKNHMAYVHGRNRKMLKCDKCPYASTSKSNLKLHIEAVHERTKAYVCEECGYAGVRRSDLRKHIKAVHANMRNHICDECGYASSRRNMVAKHMESVHKIDSMTISRTMSVSNTATLVFSRAL